MEHFGTNLKKLMEERKLSAKRVCESTGIPKSTLSEWLNGRVPTLDQSLLRLARLLGVSLEHLISGKEPEEEIMQAIAGEMQDRFTTIHKGIYRVTVDKLQD